VKIEEIEKIISEAKEKSQDAQNALAGAEQDAQAAKDAAVEAQNEYAASASKVSLWQFVSMAGT
jgi:predicted  nucleic acid-binding Zn-ribbon protein